MWSVASTLRFSDIYQQTINYVVSGQHPTL
ncbi:hypothetical protein [Escherichia coli]